MTVLITGGHSPRTFKLLKAFPGNQIVLGGYGEMPSMQTDEYRLVSLGKFLPDALAHQLLQSCLDYDADAILPVLAEEILAVAQAAVLFDEFGITVLLPVDAESYLPAVDLPATNWSVWMNGQPVAAVPELSEAQFDLGRSLKLQGAFQLDPQERFTLFTVSANGL